MSNSMGDTKTRTGETGRNTRAFQPKVWSTPQNTDQCPVQLFVYCIYVSVPKITVKLIHHFTWPLINYYDAKLGDCWYKRQRLGMNRLGNIMKIMANRAG